MSLKGVEPVSSAPGLRIPFLKSRLKFIFALYLMEVFHSDAAQACILSPPQPLVGYSGQRLSCNCTVCVDGGNTKILWHLGDSESFRIHGSFEPQSDYTFISGNQLTATFSVQSSPAANNTDVRCVAFSLANYTVLERSDPVSILIQGQLSAPSMLLTSDSSSTTVTVNWSPPFTINGTSVSYYLGNVTESGQLVATFNTTEPSYQFAYTDNNISRCVSHEFLFEVCGVNPVGEGISSNITVHVPIDSQLCDQDQPKLNPLHIAEIVCASTAAIVVIVTIVIVTCMCVVGMKRRHIKNQTEPSAPIKTSQNGAYSVTCPTRKNEAYEFVEEVHHYETIDEPVPPVYETVGSPNKYAQCQSA